MRVYFALITFAVVSVTCGPPAESPASQSDGASTSSEAEIRHFLESYYDVFSARDWPRFAEHFWPGATMNTIWTPSGETVARVVATTIPEFVSQAPEGPGSREIFEERLVSTKIRVEGGLAQAWTEYDARFGDPGNVFEWEGVDAFTLLRHQGEWRISTLVYLANSD